MRSRTGSTCVVLLAAIGVAGAAAVRAADAPDANAAAHGAAVFARTCEPCHGRGPGLDGSPMLPGAAALAAKYQGKVSPYLEERSDLNAALLRYYVRHGTGAMPMFRRTEISDAEIEAVAAYLAASAHGRSAASR